MNGKEECIEEQCDKMAAILGIEEPVSKEVLLAALADQNYANNLLICRKDATYMEYLLANPPGPAARRGSKNKEIGTRRLIISAAESLARWAKTGFSTVDEDVYQDRLSVCQECPNLMKPPKKQRMIYRIAGVSPDSRAICSECGCVVGVKARRATESCPSADPEQSYLNRWEHL